MKALLISPPLSREERHGRFLDAGSSSPPLGLLHIAAVLEEAGHQVAVIDGIQQYLSPEQVLEQVEDFGPDWVGISVHTLSFGRSRELALAIKQRFPGLPVVVGGPDVTARREEYRRDLVRYGFNVAVYGEGELTALEFTEALARGGSLEAVAGLMYAGPEGSVRENPPRPYIEDLDALPAPARHLLADPLAYRPHLFTFRRSPWTTMISSRGCPQQCTFCDRSVFGNRYRVRSATSVFAEMKELHERHGVREIFFMDDTFTINRKRVEELCGLLIAADLDLIWTCCARANNMSRDLLAKMRRAGCWMIHLGIESGDEQVLRRIKKGITLEQVRNVCAWAREVGMNVRGFFILGLPGDTPETIRRTIALAKSLPLYTVNFCITFLLPGTELTATAERYGKVDRAAFASMSGHPAGGLSFVPHGMSEAELLDWQRKAYLSFYLRPQAVWRILFANQSLADLRGLAAKLGLSFRLLLRFLAPALARRGPGPTANP